MAQTEFVGNTFTFVHGTYTLEGVLDVKITQKGGPAPEQKEITRSGHTVYTYLPDPLGPKGQATVIVVVKVQDSTASYGDNKATKIPLNTPASTTFAMEPGTANANEWTHATLELTQRVTEIPFDALATTTLTFEANGAGTWDSPA